MHNVIIIGSGPSGYTAAIYLARAGLAPLILAGEKAGGQLMLTTVIENFPGFPEGIDGQELMANMRAQALKFGAQIKDINVSAVDFSGDIKKITAGNEAYEARAILIATGAQSVWLGVPGEQQFIGRGVSTCAVCDAAFFRNKVTYVIGGGDAAMEDALALTKFASSVTLVHRRDSFKASKIMQERVLNHPKVKVIWNSGVKEIKGEQKVTALVLEDVNTHTIQELPADGVFVAIGHKPSTEIFKDQIILDEKGFVVTKESMTSVAGVFASGDCVDFRYKQAITAAGQGCMAALDIEKWLEQ